MFLFRRGKGIAYLRCAIQQETTAIVRSAFPELQAYPADRVEFLIKGREHKWQRVLPNTWDVIAANPPDRVGVRISDAAGDAGRRAQRGTSDSFVGEHGPSTIGGLNTYASVN